MNISDPSQAWAHGPRLPLHAAAERGSSPKLALSLAAHLALLAAAAVAIRPALRDQAAEPPPLQVVFSVAAPSRPPAPDAASEPAPSPPALLAVAEPVPPPPAPPPPAAEPAPAPVSDIPPQPETAAPPQPDRAVTADLLPTADAADIPLLPPAPSAQPEPNPPRRPPAARRPDPAPRSSDRHAKAAEPTNSAAPIAFPAPSAAPPAPAPPAAADPSWQSAVLAWIGAHKRYPQSARERGEQGAVGIRFVVQRDGRVTAVAIPRSSGSAALDAAARELLQGQRLPPFPPGMPETPREMAVTLRYDLDLD